MCRARRFDSHQSSRRRASFARKLSATQTPSPDSSNLPGEAEARCRRSMVEVCSDSDREPGGDGGAKNRAWWVATVDTTKGDYYHVKYKVPSRDPTGASNSRQSRIFSLHTHDFWRFKQQQCRFVACNSGAVHFADMCTRVLSRVTLDPFHSGVGEALRRDRGA